MRPYACATYDDQFAFVPARHASTFFRFAALRLESDYIARHSTAPPEHRACCCCAFAERFLTEYLNVSEVAVRVVSLPMQLAGGPLRTERTLPPLLRDGDEVWSPSAEMRCSLSTEGSWGVGGWLLDAQLVVNGATSASLRSAVSREVTMKQLIQSPDERTRLIQRIQDTPAASAERNPTRLAASFERALDAYQQRFLVRRPWQQYHVLADADSPAARGQYI